METGFKNLIFAYHISISNQVFSIVELITVAEYSITLPNRMKSQLGRRYEAVAYTLNNSINFTLCRRGEMLQEIRQFVFLNNNAD